MIFNLTQPMMDSAPKFTYTGTYEFIDDGGGNWRIKFLTSGTFTPLKAMTIDVFLVGGGASGSRSGGGGGYTKTVKSINLTAKNPYEIIIGAGGVGLEYSSPTSDGNDGGTTSAFNYNAEGGKGGIYYTAYNADDGTNGSCGGSGGGEASGGNGGSDGSNGAWWGNSTGGKGQGTTTREFGETDGDLYSGGGGGSYSGRDYGSGGAGGGANAQQSAANNTGGGGGGNWNGETGAGGSGIVIIRKHKEAAA